MKHASKRRGFCHHRPGASWQVRPSLGWLRCTGLVFLQTDPIPGGSANNYDYVDQDPINATDLAGTLRVERLGNAGIAYLNVDRASRRVGGRHTFLGTRLTVKIGFHLSGFWRRAVSWSYQIVAVNDTTGRVETLRGFGFADFAQHKSATRTIDVGPGVVTIFGAIVAVGTFGAAYSKPNLWEVTYVR